MNLKSCGVAVAVAFAALSPTHSFSQATHPLLGGMTSVRFLVENLDEDARSCGLNVDSLDAAMRIVVANSKTAIRSDPGTPILYASVISLKMPSGSCAVTTSVALLRSVSTDSSVGLARVWQKSELLISPPTVMGRRVDESIEGMTKSFVGAWLRAN